MKKKDYILISVVLIIALFLESYILDIKLANINFNIKNQNKIIEQRLSGIASDLQSSLYQFKKENIWIYDEDYQILSFDFEAKKVKLSLKWALNELEEGSEIFLLYSKLDEDNWNEVNVAESSNLSYKVDLDLDLTEDYEFRIKSKKDEMIKTETLNSIEINSMFANRIDIDINTNKMEQIDATTNIDFSLNIRNNIDYELFGLNKYKVDELMKYLKIKDIQVSLINDDKEIFKEIVFEDGKPIQKKEDVNDKNNQQIEFNSQKKSEEINMNIKRSFSGAIEDNYVLKIEIIDYLGNKYIDESFMI